MKEMKSGEIPAGEDYLLSVWMVWDTRKEPCQHNHLRKEPSLLLFSDNVHQKTSPTRTDLVCTAGKLAPATVVSQAL